MWNYPLLHCTSLQNSFSSSSRHISMALMSLLDLQLMILPIHYGWERDIKQPVEVLSSYGSRSDWCSREQEMSDIRGCKHTRGREQARERREKVINLETGSLNHPQQEKSRGGPQDHFLFEAMQRNKVRQEVTFIPASSSSCQPAMKRTLKVHMFASSIASLLLICCRLTSADSQDGCDAYGAVGGNFSVPLDHKLQKVETLRWTHNKTKIFHRKPDKLIKGKQDDVYENGSLKLTNLKRSSEGTYFPEVHDTKGKSMLNGKRLYLCVLDPVSRPGLKVECFLPNVKFTCMPGQMANTTVKWFQNNELLAHENDLTVLRVAEKVTHDSFTCAVSNQVSSMSSGSVKQNCVDSKLFGLDFRIMVSILAGMGGVALLLIVILIVCCVRAMREKHKRVQEEDELRLGWTNPEGRRPQCNHPTNRHHHSHGQTGPRQHGDKQAGEPQRPRGRPQASARRPTQGSRLAGTDQQVPPLPKPRKKTPAQRM
ncbi:uncharacterized protein LOC144053112 isoform X2 [Vanacampus margaritifer]